MSQDGPLRRYRPRSADRPNASRPRAGVGGDSVVFRSPRAVQIPLISRAEFVVLEGPNFASSLLIQHTIPDKGPGSFECASAIYVVFWRRSPTEIGAQPGEGFEIALV